jgi:hypothetical protein
MWFSIVAKPIAENVLRPRPSFALQFRAGDGVRTHDNDVGNVVLYQLSYTRIFGANRNR